jgi:predicted peptidase
VGYRLFDFKGIGAMRRRVLALILCIGCTTTCAADLASQPGQQIAAAVEVQAATDPPTSTNVPLLLYAPEDYSPEGEPWPLVLFLHGAGERGDGSEEQIGRVAIHGPARQAAAGRKLPFVLVSPQCPWSDDPETILTAWKSEVLLPLLDRVQAEMNIDPSRVYVTGLSMGGYGTWRLAAASPERFAAAVPICGGGDPERMAAALAKLPTWAFHGAKDDLVPFRESVDMIATIRAAGGNARLTVYPEAGHDSWSATYDNPMFYDWLLGLRRGESE